MREIPLTKGHTALVDDHEYERVMAHRWFRHPKGYAVAVINGKPVYLHRFILNISGSRIDHRNRNKLDCRKENLRVATGSQNNANCAKRGHNTSGYKGVSRHSQNDTWQIKIGYQGKTIYLGCHPDVIEAAKIYDKAARELYGDFAATNF